jgi:S-formylglutathione hydrolase FrmB
LGGYGALMLAFRHPDVFGAVYAMTPCCTDLVTDFGPSNPGWPDLSTMSSLSRMSSPEAVAVRSTAHSDILSLAAMCTAVAPNPKAKILGDARFFVEQHQMKTNAAAFAQITGKMVL